MTTVLDPVRYKGNGTLWKSHLRKHECRNSVKTIFFEYFDIESDCVEFAAFFSEFFDIVESDEWANLTIEDGLNNGVSSPNMSEATKRKMSISHTGTKHTKERCDRISKALTGRPKSPEHNKNNSEGQKKRKPSPDRGRKISEANLGRKNSLVARAKISEALMGRPKIKASCPHCDKVGGAGIMKRWHFDNCKLKKD